MNWAHREPSSSYSLLRSRQPILPEACGRLARDTRLARAQVAHDLRAL